MQEAPPNPLSTVQYILAALATVIAGGLGAFLSWIINRKKAPAEIVAIHATAERDLAESRQMDGGTLSFAWKRIDELHVIVDELREEKFQLQREVANLMDEIKLNNHYIEELQAANRLRVRLQDLDRIRLESKPDEEG